MVTPDWPDTIEECDRRLENCRLILERLQVRSSQRMVWIEIDDLLEHRVRLKRRRKKVIADKGLLPVTAKRYPTDSP